MLQYNPGTSEFLISGSSFCNTRKLAIPLFRQSNMQMIVEETIKFFLRSIKLFVDCENR